MKILLSLIFTLFIMTNCYAASIADYQKDTSEEFINLPINPLTFKIAYSVPISANVDDVLIVTSQYEITSNLYYQTGVGTYLVLSDTASSHLGKLLTQATMTNVIVTGNHHLIGNPNTIYKFTENFSGYINLVLYAASSACTGGCIDTLRLEPGYGNVSFILLRP